METKKFFEWDNHFSAGYKIIDDQHKELISIINNLYNRLISSKNLNLVLIFDDLFNYINEHFKYEEGLFSIYKYPDTKEHISEHKLFDEKVKDFYDRLDDENDYKLPLEMMNFLKKWWTKHILTVDSKYKGFFE